MKTNGVAILSILIAVVLSSFSGKRLTTIYWVYDGAGNQKSTSNYNVVTTSPGNVPGTDILAWFIGNAVNPSIPTLAEFDAAFEAIDGDYGGTDNDSLNDEANEATGNFEKMDDDR